MVVDQVDVVSFAAPKPKDHAPVGGNRDAPEALPISLEGVKPVSRQIEILRFLSIIKVRQRNSDALRLIGPQLALVALFIEPLEAAMAKRPDRT